MSTAQTLLDHCYVLRKNFSEMIRDMHESDIGRILFSDESHFYLDGYVNQQNIRTCAPEKSDFKMEKSLSRRKLTVWCGFSWQITLLSFFFAENTIFNGESYRIMISEHVVKNLKARRSLSRTIFMQDGAPAHIAIDIKKLLSQNFQRIIGRDFDE